MKDKATYTKIGFSKQGFSCCSRYYFCNMGKDECYYDGIDNEVKNHCNCYRRNHAKKTINSNHQDQDDSRTSFYKFKNGEALLAMACFNSNCIQMGNRYLLKEKTLYKSLTQANIYTIRNEFVGVQSIRDFSIIESLSNEEELIKITDKSNKKEEDNDHYSNGGEQLSLF